MHALLISLGTDGDVFPYLGLGRRLRQRGHRVTLLSGERYQPLAAQLGMEFSALISEAETQNLLADPNLWHPWKSAFVLARWGTQWLQRQHAAIRAHLRGGDTVLVANPGVLAARMIQEQHGVPLVSVILQPWVLPSLTAPPVMPLGTLPRWAPRRVGRAYWNLFHLVAHQCVGRDVNRFRRTLGLPPVARTFRWWLSPQRVLGLFPEWFGPPPLDWPPQLRLTGFPLFDGGLTDGLPNDVRTFLDAGPPPVAVTFGTGMQHAANLFAEVISACTRTGRRAIVLTKHLQQLPDRLPPGVQPFYFAPFRDLFPRCAAVIHHGGVGTTAQALAAGVPQLIVPFAFDQPDNGARVMRLGAGLWFRPHRNIARRVAAALDHLASPSVQARARELAGRLAHDQALTSAAAEIEQLATTRAC